MSNRKKEMRRKFREAIFARDNYSCVMCGIKPDDISNLDAHHIFDREIIINGGYVKENGITLCNLCHIKAESTHNGLPMPDGFTCEELYKKIGPSYKLAVKASKKLE